MNEEFTRAGQVIGTPAYMSPQQVRGVPLDQRADIWAFGCVLFELLSGRGAFRGSTMNDTFANILQQPPDWKALPASTPERVRTLIRGCLEKEADQRLSSIGDARTAMESAVITSPEGLPADSKPAGEVTRSDGD